MKLQKEADEAESISFGIRLDTERCLKARDMVFFSRSKQMRSLF